MGNKYKDGNFTIECAFIMPIIFAVILSVIWLIIFLYDKNVMYRALVHGVSEADYQNFTSNGKLADEIEERVYEDIKGQLLGLENPVAKCRVSKSEVTAEITASLAVPDGLLGLGDIKDISVTVSKKRTDPAGIISDVRRVKALMDMAEKIGGSENEKKKAEEE